MKDSFWIKEIKHEIKKQAMLTSHIETDVAIIGGGFVGLWTAILLKEEKPELSVVLLEKDFCGSGASGRNGGMVKSWWPRLPILTKLCGDEDGVRLAQLSAEGILEIEQFCRDHDIDADFKQSGWYWVASTEQHRGAWNNIKEFLDGRGIDIFSDVPSEDLQSKTGSNIHLEGVFKGISASIQPAKLAQGLLKVALSMGIEVYEDTLVCSIEKTRPAKINTTSGSVSADKVVIATNVWTGQLIPELSKKVLPVTSTIVLTEKIPEVLKDIGWVNHELITDSQLRVGYYRPTLDGRIMYGKGTGKIYFNNKIDENYGDDQELVKDTFSDFQRAYPMIQLSQVAYDWSGPVDRSYDNFPLFGHLDNADHIFYSVGWSGSGVGQSRTGAKILRSLVLEDGSFLSNLKLINRKSENFPMEPIQYIGGNMVRNAVIRNEQAYIKNSKARYIDLKLEALAPS